MRAAPPASHARAVTLTTTRSAGDASRRAAGLAVDGGSRSPGACYAGAVVLGNDGLRIPRAWRSPMHRVRLLAGLLALVATACASTAVAPTVAPATQTASTASQASASPPATGASPSPVPASPVASPAASPAAAAAPAAGRPLRVGLVTDV